MIYSKQHLDETIEIIQKIDITQVEEMASLLATIAIASLLLLLTTA